MNVVPHPDTHDSPKKAVPRRGFAAQIAPKNQADVRRIANWWMVACGVDPNSDGENVAKSCLKIQLGCELGLGAVQSLKDITIIDTGDVEKGPGFIIGSKSQRGLAMASGLVQRWEVETNVEAETVTLVVQRKGLKSQKFRLHISAYKHRIKTAKPGSAWINHPLAMLNARITTIAVKQLFPDILVGVMSHDEAEEVYGESGDRAVDASVMKEARAIEADDDASCAATTAVPEESQQAVDGALPLPDAKPELPPAPSDKDFGALVPKSTPNPAALTSEPTDAPKVPSDALAEALRKTGAA